MIQGLVIIKAGLGGRSEFVLRNLRASPLIKLLSLPEGGMKRLRRLEVCTHIKNGVFFNLLPLEIFIPRSVVSV